MKSSVRSLALLWVLGLSFPCLAAPKLLDGYVTQITSATEFEVGDVHIVCKPGTQLGLSDGRMTIIGPFDLSNLHVGDIVHLEGKRRANTFNATMIRVTIDTSTRLDDTALLEKSYTLTPQAPGYQGTLWIAGYPIRVTPSTHLEGPNKSAFSPGMVAVNTWVAFKARYTREGILADSLVFTPNHTSPEELKYREDNQLQFTEPDYANKKNGKIAIRLAPDLFVPAEKDVQQYIQKLGASLVPDFQKQLPESDPEKLHFRFFVMDHSSNHCDSFATPSGDIFIPGWVLLRARNESQLAFVVSTAIAWSLQRQQLQHANRIAAQNALGTATTIGNLALFATPFGLPVALAGTANSLSYKHLINQLSQRADRIALVYLEDSGYDLGQTADIYETLQHHKVNNPFPEAFVVPSENTRNLLHALSDHAITHHMPATATPDAPFNAAQEKLIKFDPKVRK